MGDIQKLNKTFVSDQVLKSGEMNAITGKIDELVDGVNSSLKEVPATYLTVEQANQDYQPKGEYLTSVPEEYVTKTDLEDKGYISSTQADNKYATLEQIGSIDAILDSINGEVI